MNSAKAVVKLEGLRCQAGGRTTLSINRLTINPGERIGLIGPNGAGKSTLLRCLNGFVTPSEGRIEVLGRELGPATSAGSLRRLRTGIAHVMQGLHMVQRLSALENVLIGCLPRVPGWRSWSRFYPADEVEAAESALRQVGMAHHARSRADRLSGGERQKLAIARMLLQRPHLILADEPTASLDPSAAEEICNLLSAAASGATLITVVHNPALLPLLADRVIGLSQGRIGFDLPLSQVDQTRLDGLYGAASPADPPGRAGALDNSLPSGGVQRLMV